MTTKQIAEVMGKAERSVQRWAKATGDNLTPVGKSGIPADRALDEKDCGTCQWGGYELCAMPLGRECICDPATDDYTSWEPTIGRGKP